MKKRHYMTAENLNMDSDFNTVENLNAVGFGNISAFQPTATPIVAQRNIPQYNPPQSNIGLANANTIAAAQTNPYLQAPTYYTPQTNPYTQAQQYPNPYDYYQNQLAMEEAGFQPESVYQDAQNEAESEGEQAEMEYEQEAGELNDYNQGN